MDAPTVGTAASVARIGPSALAGRLANVYGVVKSPAMAPVAPTAAISRISSRLVAGVVPGKVDFATGGSTAPGPLPFYRAAGDRNAAATAIAIGRHVDVEG